MSSERIIHISSDFVMKRYQLVYNLPDNKTYLDCHALELKNVPEKVINFLEKQNNFEIFIKADDREQILFLGIPDSIFSLAKEISELDKKYGDRLLQSVKNYFNYNKKCFLINEKEYSINIPYVMGIVNVTPDSFSDGGKYFNLNSAVSHALELLDEGADFIDIGGESTRPGSEPVNLNEELNRVIPVIEEVLGKNPNVVLSIDTTKSRVVYEALRRGVKIVNDISGLSFDPEIINVVKEFNAALVIMHIKGNPKNMQVNPKYKDVVFEVCEFLEEKILFANDKGVTNLIIDPGIGFGKRIQDNFELLLRLNEFKNLGYPILVGVSRKSFLGKTLNLDINNREIATVITEAYSIANGARIIRTHDVKNAVQSKNIFKFIINPELH